MATRERKEIKGERRSGPVPHIRRLPQRLLNHRGSLVLCDHTRCRGEQDCCYPHSQAELKAWKIAIYEHRQACRPCPARRGRTGRLVITTSKVKATVGTPARLSHYPPSQLTSSGTAAPRLSYADMVKQPPQQQLLSTLTTQYQPDGGYLELGTNIPQSKPQDVDQLQDVATTVQLTAHEISHSSAVETLPSFSTAYQLGSPVTTKLSPSTAFQPGSPTAAELIDPSTVSQPSSSTTTELSPSTTFPSSSPAATELINPSTASQPSSPATTELSPSTVSRLVSPATTEFSPSTASRLVSPATTELSSSTASRLVSPATTELSPSIDSRLVSPATTELRPSTVSRLVSPATIELSPSTVSRLVSPATTELSPSAVSRLVSPAISELSPSTASRLVSPATIEPSSHTPYTESKLLTPLVSPKVMHPTTSASSEDMKQRSVQAIQRRRKVFKKKYHELLNIEQKEHERVLQKECNTQCTLVLYSASGKDIPKWLRRNTKRLGYLDGLSDDQIAYVSQASQVASLLSKDKKLEVELLRENFHHLDSRLYVAIPNETVPDTTEYYSGRQVAVEFKLKITYFRDLHKAVTLLPELILKHLVPCKDNFKYFIRKSIPDDLSIPLKLEQNQMQALEMMSSSPCDGPPILIDGSFGTGKTRLLATAAQYFFKVKEDNVLVLICTQQQVSADAFLEYFLQLDGDKNAIIVRLTTEHGYRKPSLLKWYMDMEQFKAKFPEMNHKAIIVISTCISAMYLAKRSCVPRGFFTHILLDEGAQMREPEALGALCLAGPRTKIAIAGDQNQVGPVTLVLGEALDHGLGNSLLSRLLHEYRGFGGLADSYQITLVTNFRCDPAIMELTSKLFYESSLKCSEHLAITPHPSAPYPLVFVCSSIDDTTCCAESATNVTEARVVLNLVKKYVTSWPDGWEKDISDNVAIISPHRSQTTLLGQLMRSSFPMKMQSIKRLPTYIIQGHEFRAVFISTSEPTKADGSTCNPTKSICDRFVFNTAITRARSLVVAVGNPFLLLRMEEHMVEKKYGEKGGCWRKFIRVCLENGSLSIDQSVEASPSVKAEYLQKLKILTNATRIGQVERTDTEVTSPRQRQAKDKSDSPLNPEFEFLEASPEDTVSTKHICKLEEEYDIKECIGKGGFGSVFQVTNKLDDQDYAVKVIRLPESESGQKKVFREVRALAKLKHAKIVRYYGCWKEKISHDWKKRRIWTGLRSTDTVTPLAEQSPYSVTATIHEDCSHSSPESDSLNIDGQQDSTDSLVEFGDSSTSNGTNAVSSGSQHSVIREVSLSVIQPRNDPPICLFIQTELCKKGTLKDWLLERIQNRPRKTVLCYFKQIVEAVNYIHDEGMIHRDLKPSNIFFSLDKDDLKVGDFGLVTNSIAADSQSLHPGSGSGSKSYGGTLFYMSPEQRKRRKCDQKTDIFALGVILFELNCPFSTESERNEVLTILREKQWRGKQFQNRFSAEFKEIFSKEAFLIEWMLQEKPEERPEVTALKLISDQMELEESVDFIPLLDMT